MANVMRMERIKLFLNQNPKNVSNVLEHGILTSQNHQFVDIETRFTADGKRWWLLYE
nr:MAG TPA: hypothetical protein [Caudoviricetes sp.]